MLYFILWVVFIVTIFLAIPIAHFLDVHHQKKSLQASSQEANSNSDSMPE